MPGAVPFLGGSEVCIVKFCIKMLLLFVQKFYLVFDSLNLCFLLGSGGRR
jgi:hypothetical protein